MKKEFINNQNNVHSESLLLRISSLFRNNETPDKGLPGRKGSKNTSGWCRGRGFTLIELLVVVLIIGILSAIALPRYQKAVDKARLTQLIVLANAANVAAAYVISDELFNLKWEPHFGEKAVVDNLHVFYHAVIKTLLSK